jgi:hypothetical protein
LATSRVAANLAELAVERRVVTAMPAPAPSPFSTTAKSTAVGKLDRVAPVGLDPAPQASVFCSPDCLQAEEHASERQYVALISPFSSGVLPPGVQLFGELDAADDLTDDLSSANPA